MLKERLKEYMMYKPMAKRLKQEKDLQNKKDNNTTTLQKSPTNQRN